MNDTLKNIFQTLSENAEENFINFLEMLRYVSADSDSVYRILINELKQQLKSGELESFFLSEWFELLSGLDGRYFIQKMQEVYYFDR